VSAPGRLMAISDVEGLGPGQSVEGWARALGHAGVDCLQIREKWWPDRIVFEVTRSLCRAAVRPATVLVNARLDVALAAGAEGAHLPADEVSIAALRHRCGAKPILGRSTHRPEEVERASLDGADYVTFGPIFATPGKTPVGLDALAEAVAAGLPVLALGGVFPERFAEVAARGAVGVAGIRMFRDPAALGAVVAAARQAFEPASGGPR